MICNLYYMVFNVIQMYSYCQMDANTHNVSVYVERKVNSLLGNVLISVCPLGFASILFVNDSGKNHEN